MVVRRGSSIDALGSGPCRDDKGIRYVVVPAMPIWSDIVCWRCGNDDKRMIDAKDKLPWAVATWM